MTIKKFGLLFWLIFKVGLVNAEDGSRLWLRYETVPTPLKEELLSNISSIYPVSQNQTLALAAHELQEAILSFTGTELPFVEKADRPAMPFGGGMPSCSTSRPILKCRYPMNWNAPFMTWKT